MECGVTRHFAVRKDGGWVSHNSTLHTPNSTLNVKGMLMAESNILDKIVASTKKRVERDKSRGGASPFSPEPSPSPLPDPDPFRFEKALRQPGFHFICEVKKASPSKGLIAEDFPYLEIAREYEQAGATAISVLTEPEFFMGSDRYLTEILEATTIPILRKDFIIDPFQIGQSVRLGADAILLICAILSEQQLAEFIKEADKHGLSCLVEAHDEQEANIALKAGARIVGVNNRDLTTFSVDTSNSIRLRKLIPENVLFVSESGLKNAGDVELLRQNGINAALIGETLMRSTDKKAKLAELR